MTNPIEVLVSSRASTPRRQALLAAAALAVAAVAPACAAASGAPEGAHVSSPLGAELGAFRLRPFAGSGKCLDVAGGPGELDNGRVVQMWTCYGNAHQRWIYADGEVRGLGGKCLDAVGDGNGARIQVYDCWGGANQKWTFDNGTLRSATGRCLDVAGGDGQYDDGARVQLYDCNGAGNQAWSAERVSDVPAAAPDYQNPVAAGDFPDPYVLASNGVYYAYATNAGSVNVQVMSSNDLVHWSGVTDAMPELAEWVQPGLTWAPSVLARPNGNFALYYTARSRELGIQCVGRALAKSALGPFRDDSGGPLVCQTEGGGSIDASPFVDENGWPFLTWKNDGNCCNLPVSIWAQRLSRDGMNLVGSGPSELLRRDQPWEGNLIEAPSMIRHGGRYALTYSANAWDSADYGVGAAVCESPLGPCRKPQPGPIMHKADLIAGPGGQELFRDLRGGLWVAYHAWTYPETSYAAGGARTLRLDRVVFHGDTPVVLGPTASPQ